MPDLKVIALPQPLAHIPVGSCRRWPLVPGSAPDRDIWYQIVTGMNPRSTMSVATFAGVASTVYVNSPFPHPHHLVKTYYQLKFGRVAYSLGALTGVRRHTCGVMGCRCQPTTRFRRRLYYCGPMSLSCLLSSVLVLSCMCPYARR